MESVGTAEVFPSQDIQELRDASGTGEAHAVSPQLLARCTALGMLPAAVGVLSHRATRYSLGSLAMYTVLHPYTIMPTLCMQLLGLAGISTQAQRWPGSSPHSMHHWLDILPIKIS